jgi:hypothetical protein
MSGSTVGVVAVCIAGYVAVVVPLALTTGRILRLRARHLPFPEPCADVTGPPSLPVLRDEAP